MFEITRQTLDRWMKAGRIPRPMKDPQSQTYMWTQTDIDTLARIIRSKGRDDSND
jgi:predicted site-specific integrase-resolvase